MDVTVPHGTCAEYDENTSTFIHPGGPAEKGVTKETSFGNKEPTSSSKSLIEHVRVMKLQECILKLGGGMAWECDLGQRARKVNLRFSRALLTRQVFLSLVAIIAFFPQITHLL